MALKIRIVHYTVEGSGQFPFDMLRYDQSWPASTEAAIALDHENWRNGRHDAASRTYRVDLITHSNVTPERWLSFGWRVITQETRTY